MPSTITLFLQLVCAARALDAGAVDPAPVVVPPALVTAREGVWPAGVASGHDVVVPLVVVVGLDGRVREASPEVSVSPALDAAAVEAARAWVFRPASRDGVPVEARLRIAVRFASRPLPPAPPQAPPPAAPTRELAVVIRGERPVRSASEITRDRAVLAAAPHRSAPELLRLVPGLFLTQHSGEGKAHQIFYRGFDAVHGQDLEIWAGGAPVNDVSNVHGQGYADLNFLPAEVVSTLVATPGPFDPRQGDFAVAGTLRLELGLEEPGAIARVQAGSFGTERLFLGARPAAGSPRTFVAGELYRTDGFGPSRAAQRASALGQAVVTFGGASLRLYGSVYASEFASAGVLRLDDLARGKVARFSAYDAGVGAAGSALVQGGSSSRAQLVAELEHDDGQSADRLAAYVVLRGLRLRQNFTGFLDDARGDGHEQSHDATTVGAYGFHRWKRPLLSAQDAIEVGFFARHDLIEQTQRWFASTANDERAVDARVGATDAAGYFDVALCPWHRLALRGGVRADGLAYVVENGAAGTAQTRTSQGTHVGRKATAELRLSGGLSAVASWGEGFRSPQARSLGDGERTPFARVTAWELGLRLSRERVRARAAAFRTALSEDLVFDHATGRNDAVPATRRTGLATDVTWTPRPWAMAAASLTYTHAAFAESERGVRAGDLVPYAPQLVGRADLAVLPRLFDWRGRSARGRLGLGASWLDRRPLPFGEMGHSVFLLDGSASVRLGSVELGVEAWNLLDAGWYDGEFVYASRWSRGEAASLVPARHVTVGAPRTFWFRLAVFL